MQDEQPSSAGHSSRRQFLVQGTALAAATVAAPHAFAADDVIKIGYLTHRTGPFAPFAEADSFILDNAAKALSGGLSIGGKRYRVEFIAKDDQSNPDRQSNLAAELINKDGVDLMLGQATIGPGIAQQCEINGVPCITTMSPWQAWMFPMKGDPAKGFKNVFHFFWGIDDIANVYLDIWKDLKLPKVIGSAFENTLPGNAMGDLKMGMPAMFAKAGYKIVDIGKFAPGSNDFSAQIQAFKKEGAEIVTGLFAPPEWASFVKQSAQMGYKPKVMTIAKALLFPGGVQALGKSAHGMSTEIWWSPAYPFKSSLTGQTARQLADAYTAATQKEWTQPIGVMHALVEAGIAALKASGDPKNPQKVADAIRNMKQDTVIGRLDFSDSGIRNVSKMRVVGGQWIVDEKGKLDIVVTHNGTAPEIPVQRKFVLLGA
ncbi:ABC transporter substrate-binding protein [Hydrogenophaga pseudoflava]|uniref:ABC transporter substrate-binding protein n=1 Tax=Hydrogenophaga pseudoflava TaxID=47421 RepID=UPI0027E4F5C5|nr:ABC transporter substrate-binding protein [Hydrogenophaga pseudoflava]MDQ7747324.1 ABC transporter substrate-binding protein [Hydrogenophaga pseudoflava]